MINKQQYKQGTDQAWPNAVSFKIGVGSAGAAEVLWRCEALRGGRVYTSGLFTTETEAQQFAQQLQRADPAHTFNVERLLARQVWN